MLHGGEIYDKEIELDFSVNLNPYPCPQAVKDSILEAATLIDRYPDMWQGEFRKKVAESENRFLKGNFLTYENVLGGNGASELLFAVMRMLDPKKVLIPVPSFFGYRHALTPCNNAIITEYPLKEEEDFVITEDFVKKLDDGYDLVILANPNNPTGRCIDKEILHKIIKKTGERDVALVIDECFLKLTDCTTSAAAYLNKCSRLFVVNAYTKFFSIPGVRVGYVLASEDNINSLRNYLPEWNMSVFAQNAGRACADILLADDYIRITTDYIKEQRDKLSRTFEAKGCKVYPSDTNFFLVKSDENLYENFLQEKILIRDCANFVGLSKGFYRIAVKTEKENLRIMELLQSGIV